MAAKDKSNSFDFSGVNTAININSLIEYDLDDKRHVKVTFLQISIGTEVARTLDLKGENSFEFKK